MKHKPVPIGVVLTGIIYFGLLFYWQWDELSLERVPLEMPLCLVSSLQ